MKLVYVPAGEFMMGSQRDSEMIDKDEIPQHRVKITKGLYIGQTEVTLGQFMTFTEDAAWVTEAERERWSYAWSNGVFQIIYGVSFRSVGFPQTDSHPVVCVSWNDAVEFCRWLGNREGKRYRLPTEAEWEYVCRAGSNSVYQWGNRPEKGAGWCNAGDLTAKKEFSKIVAPSILFPWYDGYIFTAPVGQFRANAFGLYDMHGNVMEFCSDWYGEDYYKVSRAINPPGPANGKLRALRGGSWSSYPKGCRSAKRYRDKPSIRCTNLGFRVVLDLD
jgi:formylglycine-generating enzyme required for sulfatase activity